MPVHYCAEEFSNDGTAQSSIFKALKRTMAGEYSRDLSVRGYAGRKRTVLSGYRPGGPAGYGFRRMAVSAEGKFRCILRPKERKPFPTDRVTLVLGPDSEVNVVRRIFETFLQGMGKLGPNDIARQLNRECIPSERGGMWTHHSVWGVLTNPKYAGRLVWGRTTQQLQTNSKLVPEGSWVVRDGAFEPIVSANIFTRTQTLLHKRSDRKIPEAELIRSLKRLLSKHGHLSEKLLERAGTHAFCTYKRRFGSAQRAYDLAGYHYPAWTFAHAASAHNAVRVRNSILSRILTLFPGRMTAFNLPRASRRTNLLLDGKFKLYVWVAPHYRTKLGKVRWKLFPPPNETDGITLLCTLQPGNQDYESLYLFPALDLKCIRYSFGSADALLSQGVRVADLSQICSAARDVLVSAAIPVPKIELAGIRNMIVRHNVRPIKRQATEK